MYEVQHKVRCDIDFCTLSGVICVPFGHVLLTPEHACHQDKFRPFELLEKQPITASLRPEAICPGA